MFWLHYDRFGHLEICQTFTNCLSESADTIKRKKIWRKRIQSLLCICKPSFEEKNELDDVGGILALLNKDVDLVYSDYQAGFYLMKLEDEQLCDLRGCVLRYFICSEMYSCSSNNGPIGYYIILPNQHFEPNPMKMNLISKMFKCLFCFLKDKPINHDTISTEASPLRLSESESNVPNFLFYNSMMFKNVDFSYNQIKIDIGHNTCDWRDMRLVYYFATMAKASYGWPVNILLTDTNDSCSKFCWNVCCKHINCHCFTECILCKRQLSQSKKHLIIYPKGKVCTYHTKAILNKAHFEKENVVCLSFYNKEHYSPFFVAVSHEMKVIIVSIRGSFSANDILTDLNLNLIGFKEEFLRGCTAHSGMVKSAYNLKQSLFESNIMPRVMEEYKNYRLVITGHSLGAGIAVILACLLSMDYQNLKCYAYGIPMGTVSIELADYCKDFVLTVINGCDWISRLSLDSLKRIQIRLHNCLKQCQYAKFRITASMFLPRCSISTNDNKWNIFNVSERDCKDDNRQVKLPGQIIHIVNFKSLPDRQKISLFGESKNVFIAVISDSQQFNSLLIRYGMFIDHLPSTYVNRLHDIARGNSSLWAARCRQSFDHYWPNNDPDDIMLLPLTFLERNGVQIKCVDRKNSEQEVVCVTSVV